MCLANNCNSLVSALAISFDPILSIKSSSLLVYDDFTMVTSNVTQIAHIWYTHLSLAAMARHLRCNQLPQYLNAMLL
jgi:hypothetical protein